MFGCVMTSLAGMGIGWMIAEGVAVAAAATAGGISAYSSYQSGKAQNEIARANAKSQREQANNERLRAQQALDSAEIQKQDQRRKVRQEIGKGRVAAAGNGTMLASTPTDFSSTWEQDMRSELAYDNAKIEHNAQLAAWGYRANAGVLSAQANISEAEGRLKRQTGTLQAVSTGIGTLGTMFSIGTSMAGTGLMTTK